MSWQGLMEWILGLQPPEPGQGLNWSLNWQAVLPGWALLLFILGIASYVITIYRRDAATTSPHIRRTLIGLRLLSLGLLGWMLTEAALQIERTGLPYLLVMVDTSASMATDDPYTATRLQSAADSLRAGSSARFTRLSQAQSILTARDGEFLRQLLRRHKVRLYSVADAESLIGRGELLSPDQIEPMLQEIHNLKASGEQSRLGDALRRSLMSLRGTPPTAVILLTDGIVTEGERLTSAASYARQKSVAVYPIALGNSDPTRDIELHDVQVEDVAFVDDPVTIQCKVSSQGLGGQTAELTARFGEKGAVLATRTVSLSAEPRTVRIELPITPKEVGEFDLIIEIPAVEKESNTANNRESRRISVRKEKIRVLLADGVPRWEYRELKTLLERERTVELRSLLQDADPGFTQEDRTALANFPVRREDLYQFDVIILGDLDPALVNTSVLDNIREFVREKGGGLIVIAGPRYIPRALLGTPLEMLLPIDPGAVPAPTDRPIVEPFRPDLTLEGRTGVPFFRLAESEGESIRVWNQLPGLFWLSESPVVRKGAQVLAEHPLLTGAAGKLPVIVMQRFGAGKVLYHAADESWRWRFRTGDLYYGRYWVQVLRYLSRAKLLGKDRGAELTVDRRTYRVGDPVQIRARFLDERLVPQAESGVEVLLERTGGGPARKVSLRRVREAATVFEAVLPDLGEGAYHAWISAPVFGGVPPSQDFRLESPATESRQIRTDLTELTSLAKLTGGQLYQIDRAAQLAEELPAGRPVPLETQDPIRLWNHWLTMTLFVMALCAEWMLRKAVRLV